MAESRHSETFDGWRVTYRDALDMEYTDGFTCEKSAWIAAKRLAHIGLEVRGVFSIVKSNSP